MTNQTIDGVPRSTIELAIGGDGLAKAAAIHELRALLDAPDQCAHEWESPALSSMPDYCAKCAVDKPAAQPQGGTVPKSQWDVASNPVLGYADSYRQMARTGTKTVDIWAVITDLERNIAPLYAEQPAPVAVSHLSVKRYDGDSVSGHSDVEVTLPEMTHYDHGPNLAEALARLAARVARFHKLDAPTLATQPAPVAVMPEHRDSDLRSPVYGYARGWNACLDELKRLNPSL